MPLVLRAAPADSSKDGRPASSSASTSTSTTFVARFAPTRELLFVLLARELVVFDLELGVPAASRALPSGKAPFAALLGVYGRCAHGP